MINETLKRHLISAGLTFLTGFAIVVAPQLNETLTYEAMKEGALVGIIFAGVRAGLKAVLEGYTAARAYMKGE